MVFIIIEIQVSSDGTTAIVPPTSFTDRARAEQAYHAALSAAAVSAVSVHSVSMLSDTGERIKGECYYHGQEAEA